MLLQINAFAINNTTQIYTTVEAQVDTNLNPAVDFFYFAFFNKSKCVDLACNSYYTFDPNVYSITPDFAMVD